MTRFGFVFWHNHSDTCWLSVFLYTRWAKPMANMLIIYAEGPEVARMVLLYPGLVLGQNPFSAVCIDSHRRE